VIAPTRPATNGEADVDRPAPEEDVASLIRDGHAPVLRYLFSRLDTPALAEELTQETLVRAFGALRRGVRPAQPLPWLLGIARNVLLETWRGDRYRRLLHDRLREQAARTMGPGWAGSPEDFDVAGSPVGPPVLSTSERLGWEDDVTRRIVVAEALEHLPAELRAPVLLHYFADLPLAEVATHLGATTGAIKMRLLRARLALRPRLSDGDEWRELVTTTTTTTTATMATTKVTALGERSEAAPIYESLSFGMECGGRQWVTEPMSEPAFSGAAPTVEELRWAVERLRAARLAGPRPLAGRVTFWAAPDPFEHPDPVAVWSLMREATVGPPEFELIATDGWRLGTDPAGRALLEGLKGVGLRHIWLTFAGLERTHDALRGRTGAFAAAVRSLELAADVRVSPGANVIVSTRSVAEVGAVVDLVYSYRTNPESPRGVSVYVPWWSPFSPRYERLRPKPEHLAAVPPDGSGRLRPAEFWSDPESFTEGALTRQAIESDSADASDASESRESAGAALPGRGFLVNPRMDVLVRVADGPEVRRVANLREQSPERLYDTFASLAPAPVPPSDAELARRFGNRRSRALYRELAGLRRKWVHRWAYAKG
jgi:RNA polymerase sigma-70 factor (ECF subfamily)